MCARAFLCMCVCVCGCGVCACVCVSVRVKICVLSKASVCDTRRTNKREERRRNLSFRRHLSLFEGTNAMMITARGVLPRFESRILAACSYPTLRLLTLRFRLSRS